MRRILALLLIGLLLGTAARADTTIPPGWFGVTQEKPISTPWPKYPVFLSRNWGIYEGCPGACNEVGYWLGIEKVPGVYNFTQVSQWLDIAEPHVNNIVWTLGGRTPTFYNSSAGAGVPPTDSQNFYNYAQAVATYLAARPNNKVCLFELNNEIDFTNPTTGFFASPGNSALLVTWAAVIVPMVKAILPCAKFISPSVTSAAGLAVLDAYFAAGGDAYTDIINFHGYAPFSLNNREPEQFWSTLQWVTIMKSRYAALANACILSTEGGFNNAQVSTARQPAWTAIYALLYGNNPNICGIIWYAHDPVPDTTWGQLVDATGNWLNSAGIAWRMIQSFITGVTFISPIARVADTNQACSASVPCSGGSAGTPGTLPTGWSELNADGLTRTLTYSTINGVQAVTARYVKASGTPASGQVRIYYVGSQVAAQVGSTVTYWTMGLNWLASAAVGSITASARMQENLANGSQNGSITPISQSLPVWNWDLSKQVAVLSVNSSGDASTAFMQSALQANYTSAGAAIDFSLTMGLSPTLDTGSIWKGTVTRPGGRNSIVAWDASNTGKSFTPGGSLTHARDLTTGSVIDNFATSIGLSNGPYEFSDQVFSFSL